MKLYYTGKSGEIFLGDTLAVLKSLESGIVQCVITSPPYWGLRDYQTACWEGGNIDCDHQTTRSKGNDIKANDKQGTSKGSRPNKQWICEKCGAKRLGG